MPFKSEAQRRYFEANKAKLEKQGVDVKEWEQSSKGLWRKHRIFFPFAGEGIGAKDTPAVPCPARICQKGFNPLD